MSNWIKFLLPLTTILLIVWLGLTFISPIVAPKPGADFLKEIQGFKKDAVDFLTLMDKEGTIEIKKVDGGWQLEERKVLDLKVSELIDGIFSADKSFALVSLTPSRQEEFEVASTSARRLIFRDQSRKSLTVFVGKYSYPGNFIRIDDSNNIYLSPSVLDTLFGTDPQKFWDKIVLKIQTEKIRKFSVKKGKSTDTIIKEGDKYYVEKDKKELSLDKIKQYLDRLVLLQGDKIVTDKNEKSNYPKLLGEILVEASDQKETLRIYSGKTENLIERDSDGELFALPSARAAELVKLPTDFDKVR